MNFQQRLHQESYDCEHHQPRRHPTSICEIKDRIMRSIVAKSLSYFEHVFGQIIVIPLTPKHERQNRKKKQDRYSIQYHSLSDSVIAPHNNHPCGNTKPTQKKLDIPFYIYSTTCPLALMTWIT